MQEGVSAVAKTWPIIIILCLTLLSAQTYTWEQVLKEARANNIDLQVAREKIRQKENDLKIIQAGLLPQISAGLNLSGGASAGPDDDLFAQDPRLSQSARLSAQQQIWDPQTSPKLKQSRLALETEKLNYQIQEINLRLQLRQEFCELLRSQQALELAKTVTERRRQQYELVELRYSGGLEHRGSLLTAKANLSKAEFSAAQLERRLERSRQQLAQTIGLPSAQNPEVIPDLTLRTDTRQKPDIEQMLENSPTLQSVIARLENAGYNTQIAKAAYLPSVYLNGSLNKSWSQSKVNGETVNNEDTGWSLGTGLSFDLFDGGKKDLNVRNAEAYETIQKLELANSRQTIALTLRKAWDNLLDALDNIDTAQEQLKATSERSTIAAEQYANGLISFDNWILIEDALIAAQQTELSSKIDALLQEASWLNAKGGNLDEI